MTIPKIKKKIMKKKAIPKNKNFLNITLITIHMIAIIKINNNNITLITIIFYNINIYISCNLLSYLYCKI